MPPPLGGVALRWISTGDGPWVEGVVSFAREQTRLNSADLSDARIGGLRTRTSIANYFNGTATDLGLVGGGVLLATGEGLAAVQSRILGEAAAAPLFTSQPGFVVIGVRAGWRVTPAVDLTAIGENLTDRNYRLYGSGVDAPGANLQLRLRYQF
jgi:outer membrane receptor protein involved in Fe transport